MISIQKPRGYWTKEKCRIEALKYKAKSEFQKKSVSAYDKSLQKGWLNEVCSHMNSRRISRLGK